MGSIVSFREIKRSLPATQPTTERVHHSKEFYKPADDSHKVGQAARCMDCGVPFCHSACPLGNLIPEFNEAVYEKDWKLAYDLLTQTNNFPEFTGRICPAPCEGSCVLGINRDAVAIEYIEKSIAEKAYEEGYVKARMPQIRTSQKVAIVGSGPAGLACADILNQKGHKVTIFEKSDKVGGLLRYGIPDFKLDKSVLDRRLDLLIEEGIEFKTKVNIGVDVQLDDIVDQHDAVVLCGGSEKPRDLNIEGRELAGVYFAMDFLKQCNQRVSGRKIIQEEIDVKGKNVLVIGGGDTGSDCIGSSNRLGAKSVTQIEILSKPPPSRAIDNPWPQWPMILKESSSHEEGCDRHWSTSTTCFQSDDGKQVSGIEVVDINWEKGDNGYGFKELPNSKRVIKADVIFLAMGFVHPIHKGLLADEDIEFTNKGNVLTKEYQTSKSKVFSAGDMRRGQSLVVWAIAEGRECASQVDQFLDKQ